MKKYLVITVLTRDRPRIANQLTSTVTESNCNILDSRMATLGSEFTISMLISGEAESLVKFENALKFLEQELDLQTQIKYTKPTEEHHSLLPYSIQVLSLDAPGIIKDISTFFSNQSLNIENMHSESYKAPHTAAPMLTVDMTVNIPEGIKISDIREQFLDYCDELNLDATIEPLKT
ncbi:MAG: glycine cleavage system protein R [Gammaproteobacteria bacterium]|nr:glycine cleavage system protein R [Gammaproteobacteria bacterium]